MVEARWCGGGRERHAVQYFCDVGETGYTSLSTLWEYTCWTKGLATLRSLHRTVCLLLARSRERDDEREATRTESEATSAAGETAKKVNGVKQHECGRSRRTQCGE